jgi:hypothetical protein
MRAPALENVHYSDQYRYTYVDTPKTGCSTIKRTLNDAEVPWLENATHAYQFGYSGELISVHDRSVTPLRKPIDLVQFSSFIENSFVVFAFIRNPFTRVLSAYLDKIAVHAERRKLFLDAGRDDKPPSFLEFLRVVLTQTPREMDPHWRPQFQHGGFGRINYTSIGAFENFDADLASILETIKSGLSQHIVPMREHRTSAQYEYIRYYDAEAIDIVQRKYREDFKYFGYSMDINLATELPRGINELILNRHV